MILSFTSCENDPCDEGYTQIENGMCIPDYVVGIENDTNIGDVFYHREYGAISFKDGKWYDQDNLIIESLDK